MTQTCRNCDNSFEGNFCNQCGQKSGVNELTLKDVLHETWLSLTNTDSGILRLIKDLVLRPKSVYLNYFEGQRKKYFSPVSFFLITVAILLFLGIKVLDYEDYKFNTLNEFGRYALLETKFKTILLLPFEILITFALFHKQYNLAKHIVFWLYLNGFLFTVKILLTPLFFVLITHLSTLDIAIQILQYLILLAHLILVFGNRKWTNILFLFVVTNLIVIADYILTGYLLFGKDLLKQTNSATVFQLILNAYQL